MSITTNEACFRTGTVVDNRLKIIRRIAAGSMGTVYECEHLRLGGRKVALKVLRSDLARDAISLNRFQNEISVSYDVTHPNVVRAYDFIQDGDVVGYSMEYVDGPDLSELIDGHNSIPIVRVVEILMQICHGLKALHDAGIIHRDLKPSNILITKDGSVRVSDFGIARIELKRRLTDDGAVLGSIDYLSPEYIRDGSLDARCDIYGLGMLAYRMISPKPPFVADSVMETLRLRASSDPRPPSFFRSECPEELDRIVLKAMAHQPDERYQDVASMLKDLAQIENQVEHLSSIEKQIDIENLQNLEGCLDETVVVHRKTSAPTYSKLVMPTVDQPTKAQLQESLDSCGYVEEVDFISEPLEEDDFDPFCEPAPRATPHELLPVPIQTGTYRISKVERSPRRSLSGISLSVSPVAVGAVIAMGTLGASIILREPLAAQQHSVSANYSANQVVQTVALEVPSTKKRQIKPFKSTFRKADSAGSAASRARLKTAAAGKVSYEAFPPAPGEEFKLKASELRRPQQADSTANNSAVTASAAAPAASEPKPSVQNLVHVVRYSGETLAAIADWYAGDFKRWEDILKTNSSKESADLAIGETISIPHSMVKNTQPMPREQIFNFRRKLRRLK